MRWCERLKPTSKGALHNVNQALALTRFRVFPQKHPPERAKRINTPVPGSGVVTGGDGETGEEEEDTANNPLGIGGTKDDPPSTKGIPGEVILLSSIAAELLSIGTRFGMGRKLNGNSIARSGAAWMSGLSGDSNTSGAGSFEETGCCATGETRFPQRPLASRFPSVITVSSSCRISGFFVQKTSSSIR